MAAKKEPEFDNGTFYITATALFGMSNIDMVNEIKLTKAVDDNNYFCPKI